MRDEDVRFQPGPSVFCSSSDGTGLLMTSYCSALASSVPQSSFSGQKLNKNPVLSLNLFATLKIIFRFKSFPDWRADF